MSEEELEAVKRVLKLVDGFLAKLPQDTLTTDGEGLLTWGELRLHVQAASRILEDHPCS